MAKKIIFRIREADRAIFEAIASGKKKVETRAATVKFKNIKQEDTIMLVCGKDKLEKSVKKAKIFKNIAALLKEYNFRDINPAAGSLKDLEKMYDNFPGYKEKIKEYGLIALEL